MRNGYLQVGQRTNRNEWMFAFASVSLVLDFVPSFTK
jgi:hypothetical protein